jgi:hypothetical protein
VAAAVGASVALVPQATNRTAARTPTPRRTSIFFGIIVLHSPLAKLRAFDALLISSRSWHHPNNAMQPPPDWVILP